MVQLGPNVSQLTLGSRKAVSRFWDIRSLRARSGPYSATEPSRTAPTTTAAVGAVEVNVFGELSQDVVGLAGELAGDRQRSPVDAFSCCDVFVIAVVWACLLSGGLGRLEQRPP